MKTIKIIMPIIALFLLCGCEIEESESSNKEVNKYDYNSNIDISFYTDYQTCVEYLIYTHAESYKGMGGLSVRYNANGTIKVNKKCLEEKKRNEDN